MASTSDSRFQVLGDQLDEAWTADIPNLVEIRRCRKQMIEHIALCVLEVMQADEDEHTNQLTLRVITNDSPLPSIPKGICSPIKTEEIKRFEDLAGKST